jgi:CheY-like chemotaxis protein/predicted  nucleic acid-binding Zn-ribbon protein
MAGRALIIDKDADLAERLADALGRVGLEVETRATGREGMERAKASPPSVIVLCVELDDTSGYSICAKIKKDAALKPIPLVITSEKATQETFDHHKKLKTRAQVYLMKPFEPEALVEALKPLVDLGASADLPIEDVEPLPGEETAAHDALGSSTVSEQDPDTGAELDEAIASLSDQPPPLPDELSDELQDHVGIESAAGLPEEYDEDDVRTTIGQIPTSNDVSGPRSGSVDLPPQELLRRLKEAERARDEAIASERSTQAQLQALAAGASQLPAASSASREVLAVKKELNAKEREVLELRDRLQERDRQLLDARDREAELEERVVQTEEARSQADRARVEAESRIAGAEARAEEIERSSKATIADLDTQVDQARAEIERLEGELTETREALEKLRAVLAERESTLEAREQDVAERDAALAARDARIGELETRLTERDEELVQTRGELEASQQEREALSGRIEALERELDEARGEIDALRSGLSDTEGRLDDAVRRIRDDEEMRAKARQAMEIALNLLSSADYAEDDAQTAEEDIPVDDATHQEDALAPPS